MEICTLRTHDAYTTLHWCRLIDVNATLYEYHMLAEYHYENTPIQIYRKFHLQNCKFSDKKNSDNFHITAQNIDCGYSLEPPRRVPKIYVLNRNKKNNVYPCKPQFYYIKVGFKGVKIYIGMFSWCLGYSLRKYLAGNMFIPKKASISFMYEIDTVKCYLSSYTYKGIPKIASISFMYEIDTVKYYLSSYTYKGIPKIASISFMYEIDTVKCYLSSYTYKCIPKIASISFMYEIDTVKYYLSSYTNICIKVSHFFISEYFKLKLLLWWQ